jgi:predicted GNAT family N-acyltransferase
VSGPRVRPVEQAADLEACLRLRWTVFVEEQSVPPSLEKDAHDRLPAPGEERAPLHAIAEILSPRGAQVPCGTGRLIWPAPGLAKLQRMAVIDDARGRGVGRGLVRFLEQAARALGAKRFTLDAQIRAQAFWEKEGYTAVGGVFDDAGIAHVKMEKDA